MRNLLNLKQYNFCLNDLADMRQNFKHKICYKKKYSFLNLKHTPTYALTNRLMKKGNFLKTYKTLKSFYYKDMLRGSFNQIPIMSNFLFFYNKYHAFKDLDRVLIWKYNQLDCMFSAKTRKIKQKKKEKKKQNVKLVFITGIKRVLLCINFIKYVILLRCKRKKKNMSLALFNPLFHYLTQDKVNSVIKVKYRIYKHKLMQLQS